jgi:hypothetical protein
MYQSDLEANTGKVENTFDFSKLSGYQEVVESMPFCQAQDAQMQDNERGRKSKRTV